MAGLGYYTRTSAARKWAVLPARTSRCQTSWKPNLPGQGLGHFTT